jgi:Flp pilus assembly protein TadB
LKLASRGLEVQELKFFMISLTIQQETGGNLGELLYNTGERMN